QAKVSKAERNMGLEPVEIFSGRPRREDGSIIYKEKDYDEWKVAMAKLPRKDKTPLAGSEEKLQIQSTSVKNTHPTIKPVALMTYLCRLITPPNGIVLDPFMGSGSTGISALLENFRFCGMEMDSHYFKIAEARINSYEDYRKFIKK
ncbi:site-specific DNA-methyltransferase, partial [bacterium]|nr:site-specific DNA-methyltransferase [bacterium]